MQRVPRAWVAFFALLLLLSYSEAAEIASPQSLSSRYSECDEDEDTEILEEDEQE